MIPMRKGQNKPKEIKMLNINKVRLMTQLAVFKKKQGKDIEEASRYFKSDYISKKIIKIFLQYTLLFILLSFIMLLTQVEMILVNLNLDFISALGKTFLMLYCLGAVISCVTSGMYFASKYESIHRLTLYYEAKLEKILSISESDAANTINLNVSLAQNTQDAPVTKHHVSGMKDAGIKDPRPYVSDSEAGNAPDGGWLDEDLDLSSDEPDDGWLDTVDDNWEDTQPRQSQNEPKDGWLDDDYQIDDDDNATENVQISPDDWEEDPGQTKNHGGRQS